MAIIKVEGLSKHFGSKKALDRVSFKVEPNEFIVLLGPNGAGKTTLVKILLGILTPTAGKVLIDGFVPWERKEEFFKRVGFVFGNRSSLFYHLPVKDSFEFFADVYGIPEWGSRLKEIAEMIGITHLLKTPVKKLSFGQRILCEIALSLLHDPKILFFDEITIGLDPAVRMRIYRILKMLNKDKTIIYTTHNLWEVEILKPRILFLYDGNLVMDGNESTIKKMFPQEIIIQAKTSIPPSPFKDLPLKAEANYIQGKIPKAHLSQVLAELLKYGVVELEIREPSLEDLMRRFYEKSHRRV